MSFLIGLGVGCLVTKGLVWGQGLTIFFKLLSLIIGTEMKFIVPCQIKIMFDSQMIWKGSEEV